MKNGSAFLSFLWQFDSAAMILRLWQHFGWTARNPTFLQIASAWTLRLFPKVLVKFYAKPSRLKNTPKLKKKNPFSFWVAFVFYFRSLGEGRSSILICFQGLTEGRSSFGRCAVPFCWPVSGTCNRKGHYDEKRDNARCLIAAKSVVSVKNVATLQNVLPVLNVYWTEIAEFCAATRNQR